MQLFSKTISMRLVKESDAEFIVSLRTDQKYNKFLSVVASDIEAQRNWIKQYKADEKDGKQFYFIIERLDGTPCGTVRIYDLQEKSFSWGSWILNESKTKYSAIESAFLVYEFGFNKLNYQMSHFEVMKGNEKVISFHEKMGAIETREDPTYKYFEITRQSVADSKVRLSKLLTA